MQLLLMLVMCYQHNDKKLLHIMYIYTRTFIYIFMKIIILINN